MSPSESPDDGVEDMDIEELKQRYRVIEGLLYRDEESDIDQYGPESQRLMDEGDRIENKLQSELSAEEFQELKESIESGNFERSGKSGKSDLEQEVSNWERRDLEYAYIQQQKMMRDFHESTSVGRLEHVVEDLEEVASQLEYGGTETHDMYHSIAKQLHHETELLLADLKRRRFEEIDWNAELPKDLKAVQERDIDFDEYNDIVGW